MIITVLGGFFGDEGKGKLVNSLIAERTKNTKYFYSKSAKRKAKAYSVRSNGGPNGGHALKIGSVRISGHILPSSITKEDIISVIGAGCALEPFSLKKEIENFKKYSLFKGTLLIDPCVEIILKAYQELDALKSGLDSTGSGIRYVYGYKAKRTGIKLRDLYSGTLEKKLKIILNDIYAEYYSYLANKKGLELYDVLPNEDLQKYKAFKEKYSFEKVYKELKESAYFLKNYMSYEIESELRKYASERLIFNEGSQSYFLSITSRFDKSSSSIIDPLAIYITQNIPLVNSEIYFVVKSFGSRVGNGFFVGEYGDRSKAKRKKELLEALSLDEKNYLEKSKEMMLSDDEFVKADGFRLYYNEFGETTGRPRGKAPLDLVALRTLYERTSKNSLIKHYLVINQLDGLEFFEEIPIIYAYEINGKEYLTIPSFTDDVLKNAKAKIVYLKAWKKSVLHKEKEFLDYIAYIEKETGFKIKAVGYGPKSEEIMFL